MTVTGAAREAKPFSTDTAVLLALDRARNLQFWQHAGYTPRQITKLQLSNTRPPEAELRNTPLPDLISGGSALDYEVLNMLQHKGRSSSKRRSRRLKFLEFVQDQGLYPIPIPTPAVVYMKFMLWLPQHNITSGWKGCLTYCTELAQWNLQLGFNDERDEASYWWTTFRHNFQTLVTCAHLHAKLPLRPHMLAALLRLLNWNVDTDVRDGAAYVLLYYTSQRIGHVAVNGITTHALRFESIYFYPSIALATIVFICFLSSKTRSPAANTPFWAAIAAQPNMRRCPVQILRLHFTRSFKGDREDFLFQNDDNTGPLSRHAFTRTLRQRLAATGLIRNLRHYSGISFRRGALSTLGQSGVPSHTLADFADHASVQVSRTYTMDTMHARAATGLRIGQAVAACERLDPPVPICAAHALAATGLFDSSVQAAADALHAVNNQLSAEDKANEQGFSISAVTLVASARTAVLDLGGPLAVANSRAIRATGRAVVLNLPGHFVTALPAPGDRWCIRDNLKPDRVTAVLPADTRAALVIGAAAVPGLRGLAH